MNTAGWFLTESGRQPWIVQGLMLTKNGSSPSPASPTVISVVIFIALYLILAALFLVFMRGTHAANPTRTRPWPGRPANRTPACRRCCTD